MQCPWGCSAGSSWQSGQPKGVAGIQQSNQNHRWTWMSQGQGASGQAEVRANRSKMSAFLLLLGSGIHYLPWVKQPENIHLVKTGDSKPGSSAGSMPCVYTHCCEPAMPQGKDGGICGVRKQISSLFHPELRTSCGQCWRGEQLPLQSPPDQSLLSKDSLFLHHLLLKAGDFLTGRLPLFLEMYHWKFLSTYLLDCTKHVYIYMYKLAASPFKLC